MYFQKCLIFFIAFMVLGNTTVTYADSAPNRFQLRQDFLRLLKDRTSYMQVRGQYLDQSNNNYEQFYEIKGQWQYQPRWRFVGETQAWQSNQPRSNEALGTLAGYEVGVIHDNEEIGEWQGFHKHQGSVSGVSGAYSSYWQPIRWTVRLFWNYPWDDTFLTRGLGGSFDRAQAVADFLLPRGWNLVFLTRSSVYELLDEASFQTQESFWQTTLGHFWFGKAIYGLAYTFQRSFVENSELPVLIPEQLNHIVQGRVEYPWTLQHYGSLEVIYQQRVLAETNDWIVRGTWTYESSDHLRYFLLCEDGVSHAFQAFLRQTQVQFGVRWNWEDTINLIPPRY